MVLVLVSWGAAGCGDAPAPGAPGPPDPPDLVDAATETGGVVVVDSGGGDTGPPLSVGPSRVDADGDGVRQHLDCDDADPTVGRKLPERCNGLDDDCDGAAEAACTEEMADRRIPSPTLTDHARVDVLGDIDGVPGDDLLLVEPDGWHTERRAWLVPSGGLRGTDPLEDLAPAWFVDGAPDRLDLPTLTGGDVDGDGRVEVVGWGLAAGAPNMVVAVFRDLGGAGGAVSLLDAAWTVGGVGEATPLPETFQLVPDVDGDGGMDASWTMASGSGAVEIIVVSTDPAAPAGPRIRVQAAEGSLAAFGDADADGSPDLVLAGGADCGVRFASCVRWFSAGTLTSADAIAAEDADRSWTPRDGYTWGFSGVQAGFDADGDGKEDLAFAGFGPERDPLYIVVDLGTSPTANLEEVTTFSSSVLGPWTLGNDFDRDGRADLTTAGLSDYPAQTHTVLLGRSFADHALPDLAIELDPGPAAAYGPGMPRHGGDLDADGLDDVVTGPTANALTTIFYGGGLPWAFSP